MSKYKNTSTFFLNDFPKTLFPLELNRVLVESASESLGDYIYGKITHNKNSDSTFLTQTKAYASKSGFHLRRTAKLDPVAEFFLYDLTYRNRSKFRKSYRRERENYGYRFESGQPISATSSYQKFKEDVRSEAKDYRYCAKFDISSYFNSIYHHDLVMWFNTVAETEEDSAFFDKFLKQLNNAPAKAGGFAKGTESPGYTSTKRRVSCPVPFGNYHWDSAQSDVPDIL